MNSDGTGRQAFYPPATQNNDGQYQLSIDWGANGKILIYEMAGGWPWDDRNLLVINDDGTGLLDITHPNSTLVEGFCWSFDDSKIVYRAVINEVSQLWMCDPDGSNRIQITGGPEPKYYLDFVSSAGGCDTDGDGLSDTLENSTCTDALDADTDDDGIMDGVEDANHNGLLDSGETDPCNSDTDGDGINDGPELDLWASLDCTSFGCSECWNCDIDGDGQANNILDSDSDGDEIIDGQDTDPLNGGSSPVCLLDARFDQTVVGYAGVAEKVDLISLHFDHASDKDDGHSAAADRTILQSMFGIDWIKEHVIAVSGAYGTNAEIFNQDSDNVMEAVWNDCGGWISAHENREDVVNTLTNRWSEVLIAGGNVWVKEGGQSDLTADVVERINNQFPDIDTVQKIHVVQHSDWNEEHTTEAALAYTKEHTHYIRIPDANPYLLIMGGDGLFVELAREHPVFGAFWNMAFTYLDPEEKLDFSDTGELMHILGVGELSIDAFRKRFFYDDSLVNGLEYYTDRDYTLTDVPSAYVGMDAVLTPNDDRNRTDTSGYVTFPMPYDGTLYVAFDSRAISLPIWMNGFVDTGDILLTSLSTQPSLRIYRKTYLQGDCIDFGANQANGFDGATVSNYLVFMERLSTEPPVINDPPDDVTVEEGHAATFRIGVAGTVDLNYRWTMDGIDVGDDSPVCTITNCQLTDSGAQISCAVSNAYGTTISAIATLTVTEPSPCALLDGRLEAAILSEALAYYTDRDYTLTDVPSAYVGMDAVLTPNDDRNRTDTSGYVTFPMPYDGTLYVAFDSRAISLPIWMNGFVDTGDILLTSLSTQPSLRIYRKTYLQGDCIDFGANQANGFDGATVSNYLVFMERLSTEPPVINDPPDDVTVEEGHAATFRIGVAGTVDLNYRWTMDGIDVGDDSPVCTITNCQLTDSGAQISCAVSNAYGTTISAIATLTVTEPSPCALLDGRLEAAILSEALAYYTDRDYTLTDVPSAYVGMDAVLTPNDDRNRTDTSGYVTFPMPYDGTLYVAFDSRAISLPIWMNGFVDTGDILLTSLSTQPSLRIYRKTYLQGDCIDFGANQANGFDGATVSNYLVFMERLSTEPPVINDPPDDVTVEEGHAATFRIGVAGTVDLNYRWTMDGIDVGDDSPVCTITNCQLTDSGAQISCAVSNAYGTTISAIATLTVTEPSPCALLDGRLEAAILSEALAYYTDRDYTLTDVPSAYVGMDAVLTPNDDRNRTDTSGYVTFPMPYDGTLYVAFDSRAISLPIWMNGFVDTGDILLTSLSTQPSLRIYSQAFNQGDCVSFGANKASGFEGGTVSNYLLFYTQ